MNSKIYRQSDSRWGKLPYKNKSNVSGSGCGLCSILHCIIEMDKYKNYTPKDIHSYMRQFAVDGQGTLWSGIPTAMKHFGLLDVHEDTTMTPFWNDMAKGNRVAVLLMKKGKCKDGTVWTTSGHFVAVLDYRKNGSYHEVYVKDSSNRKNDGWFKYEKSMINHISKIWVGTLPQSTKKTYTGSLPNLNVTTSTDNAGALVKIAKELCHPYGTAEKKWAYKTGSPLSVYKTALKKYMNKTAKISQSDCGYFINTVVRKSGIDSTFKALAGTKEKFPKCPSKFKVVLKGKKATGLKKGDIIRYKTKSGQHVLMYYGDGKIAEAGRGTRFPVIRKSTKYNGSSVKLDTLEVLRVNETSKTVVKSLSKGDSRSAEIKKLQSFLNWYLDTKLVVDGIWGTNTQSAVGKAQKKLGITVDYKWGSKSNAKSKEVKK